MWCEAGKNLGAGEKGGRAALAEDSLSAGFLAPI